MVCSLAFLGCWLLFLLFFFNDTATTEIYTLSYTTLFRSLAVPVRQLALAYYQTYGLTKGFSGNRLNRINVAAYRFAVRSLIPRVARALVILHRQVEPADPNTAEVIELRKEVSAVAAESQLDKYRHKAGIG